MADKLKIKVRCDDGVLRAIIANLGTLDPVTRNYTMQMSEDFVTALVDTFHDKKYTGVVDVVLEKE